MESPVSQAPARSAHRRQCDRRTRRTAGTARTDPPELLLAGLLRAETLRRALTTHDHTETGTALCRVSWGRVGRVALRCGRPRPRVGRAQCRRRVSTGRVELSLTCAGAPCQAQGPGFVIVGARRRGGGACARLMVRWVCARAPSLTSVRDPRVGSGAGDMMFDGMIPLGEALRPLGLSGPSHVSVAGRGMPGAGRGDLCDEGLSAHRDAHAGWSASSPSSRSVW